MLAKPLLFCIPIAFLCTFEAAKILAVFPFETPSQCHVLTPFLRALAQRNHELTVIHAYPECETVHKVKYIRVEDKYRVFGDFNADDFLPTASKWSVFNLFSTFMIKIQLNVLQNEEVQNLMNSNATFDLVILESSNTDALYGLAAHFNAPLVGLATTGSDWSIDALVGYTGSSISEPMQPSGYRNGLTLFEQFHNWAYISEEWLMLQLLYLPQMRQVYEQFFPHLSEPFEKIRHSFSLILLNQHFSLGQPRPNVPGVVEVGGFHLTGDVPALPQDLAVFIEEATHGVIYFALGIELQSKDLSATTLRMLLQCFESLPQRVIWKYEGEPLSNVSANIYIGSWLPQRAILAHSNVKLFITHGGQLSFIETAYFGKPVLGLPHYFDQFRNIDHLTRHGLGISLDLNTLTGPVLTAAIEQVISDPQYQRSASAYSHRFRDQPMQPMQVAVYWTEYVLRYKGASHMRVPVYNMKFIDYYSLDKLLMIGGRITLLVILVVFAFFKLNPLLGLFRASWERLKWGQAPMVPQLK
ncbi:UDP-glucuronosyltransferase 2B15 [Scaptodrosophila lebanonensis]|uniref:UDP-glucuronosyltransferase n=1 Tax=Drosophila lebanonensis TaxID=7225 RepID=A0A6J2TC98_DROLE|nr:UDP-glucuronosyltransferase 2B15 [Scaptodrosophila lebanonensis]